MTQTELLAPIVTQELATVDRLLEIARRSHDPLVALEGYRSRLVDSLVPPPVATKAEEKRAMRGAAKKLAIEAFRTHGASTPTDQLFAIIEGMAKERGVRTNGTAISRAVCSLLTDAKQTAEGPLMGAR